MKFSANWLNEYLSKPLKPEQMADLLTKYAFEVENVEKKGGDAILEIKVLPDRAPDCLSHIGIARELAAITDSRLVLPKINLKKDKSIKIKNHLDVLVKDKKLCPRYSLALALDVKVGDSPEWLKERLIACGLRPINNIVDITNYVMLETGQPLHAFDLDKIAAAAPKQKAKNNFQKKQIIVRRAKNGEKIATLDEGKTIRILDQDILVIADSRQPIAIAGIKGGRGPEIDNQTRNIVIEAANFDAISIIRSVKRINLKTDASTRFENGLDVNLTVPALERCLALISQLAGGKIAGDILDVCAKKNLPKKIKLSVRKAQGLLGEKISAGEIIKILNRLGIEAKILKKEEEIIEAIIPTRRLDLKIPEDLIEEIGRFYGYEKIAAQMPSGVIVPAIKNEELVYLDKIRDILMALGWSEVYNYSFVSADEQELYLFQDIISIKNPLSREQAYLRTSLIAGLLKNVKENLKYFSEIRLFEIGRVFFKTDFKEKTHLSAVISLKDEKNNFFELKGAIEVLFEKLGITDVWFDDHIEKEELWLNFAHPARRAQIKSGDNLLGWAAEVSPEILRQLNISHRPAFFEIDAQKLIELASEERMYLSPSKYPAVTRDLAVFVGPTTKIEEVLNVIELAGGRLLFDTDLFDIYDDLENNRKSLAFHLVFQSDERNLSDREVNNLMEEIMKKIEEEGWEVRK